MIQITAIEPIEWKVSEPLPGEFPCMICHGENGNATHFIKTDIEGEHVHMLKLPACEKCAEYARKYPPWLEEILFLQKLKTFKAISDQKPENCPAMVPGF